MSGKYIELAKKLSALADGGVGGESYNAQKALDQLMAKHGITKEQLEENKLAWLPFERHTRYMQLFHQVAMSVIGDRGETYREHRTKRRVIYLETTLVEQMEIKSKFSFYFHAYQQDEQNLLRAFIMRNNLYNIDAEGKTTDELSNEELAAIAKAANLARGMETHQYHRALNAPEK